MENKYLKRSYLFKFFIAVFCFAIILSIFIFLQENLDKSENYRLECNIEIERNIFLIQKMAVLKNRSEEMLSSAEKELISANSQFEKLVDISNNTMSEFPRLDYENWQNVIPEIYGKNVELNKELSNSGVDISVVDLEEINKIYSAGSVDELMELGYQIPSIDELKQSGYEIKSGC